MGLGMCMSTKTESSSSNGTLENEMPMKGKPSRKVIELIRELLSEGLI